MASCDRVAESHLADGGAEVLGRGGLFDMACRSPFRARTIIARPMCLDAMRDAVAASKVEGGAPYTAEVPWSCRWAPH